MIQAGLSFSSPYYYDGLRLGGLPFYVDCAERKNFKHVDECEDIQLCVMGAGSSHLTFALTQLPQRRIVAVDTSHQVRQGFVNGTCNVFLMQGSGVSEAAVRAENYTGEYATGSALYSKEPVSIVSSAGDPRWADFINSILHAVLAAEQHGVTQSTAHLFPQTSVFGKDYKDCFRNAIAAVGNYAEIYERHMQAVLPRASVNRINDGRTGLMCSHPTRLQEGTKERDYQSLGPVLRELLERGRLRCGL